MDIMDTTTRKHTLAALAFGLSLIAWVTPSHATHSWDGSAGPYHWARTTPQFTLKVGNNMTTAAWNSHLTQTSIDWNNSGNTPVLTAVVVGNGTRRCSMTQGTTQVCNGKYGFNGWLGLATINIIGGLHITQGSAKMNDSYFNLAKYNNPNEKLHVVCQEVAHTFGLGHQSEDGSSQNSCMDYFSNTGTNATSTLSTKPNQHDFDQLFLIYNHVDDISTVDTSAAAPAPKPGKASAVDITDDPKSWGQLKSQSANGRSSIYERANTDGSTTLTHVYWTEEVASFCPTCDHRYQSVH